MPKFEQMHATDKDIYDLLVSSEKRMTQKQMREIPLGRRILVSQEGDREDIASYISCFSFDHEGIVDLLERCESGAGREKTASATFQAAVKSDEMKEIIVKYATAPGRSEVYAFATSTDKHMILNVKYDEFDYSRNRLSQRQKRIANLSFEFRPDSVSVRFPSTLKARQIVADLKNLLESEKKEKISYDEISLVDFTDPKERTEFFLELISSIPDHSLVGVTTLRVSSAQVNDVDEEDEAEENARAEMLSVVKGVYLQGTNLMISDEYRRLRESGFFITSIIWEATQNSTPYELVKFDVGFEDPKQATGFRYSVRTAPRGGDGKYRSVAKTPNAVRQSILFDALESTAREILAKMRKKVDAATGEETVHETS
ncbi:hypothetical protein [Salinarimonas sp.]|uniref:hypothetical protein n=1 Tax=Salinarimonas sp. TaxID=2766526 RepID=UPI0039187DD2